MSDWFVYLLRCSDGSLYTGITTDVVRRLAAHNRGAGARYTRTRRPVRVVFLDARLNHSDALRSEFAIKRMSRRQKHDLVAAAQVSVEDLPESLPCPRDLEATTPEATIAAFNPRP